MGGGLNQLVFVGAQNLYLTGNPSISFFKSVYHTHTNFSMESKRLELNKSILYFNENTQYICKVKRHGDLVSEMYLCLDIPDIYNNNSSYEFKWVENLGEVIVEKYEIYIGGSLIDKQYGEWLHIWNELTLSTDKRNIYNQMIGNTIDLYDPKTYNNGTYPDHVLSSGLTSIKGRQLIIPFKFWFNNNLGLALPLKGIQYQDVEIHIELKKITDLYLLFDGTNYIRPNSLFVDHSIDNFIDTQIYNNNTYLEINPYIEANYIFLDNIELNDLIKKNIEYLIEQVSRIDYSYLNNEYNMINLTLQNPVKELIWVFKRTDNKDNNKWFNFIDNDTDILKSARILFNGLDRIEDKNASYFNIIQPYQHHTNTKNGVYVYSFSIKPSMYQPSGFCNMSMINKIQLYTVINTPLSVDYQYDISIYAVNYNFLRVLSGSANVAFNL